MDGLETQVASVDILVELETSEVVVQRIHQGSQKW